MDKEQTKTDSSTTSLPKMPKFKKSLTLLSEPAPAACQDDCCTPASESSATSTCTDDCCTTPSVRVADTPLQINVIPNASTCQDACCNSKDLPQDAELILENASGVKWEFNVQGMDCPACAVTIEKSVGAIKGIGNVKVNYSTGKMQIIAGEEADLQQLPGRLKKLGYTLEQAARQERARVYNIEGMDCGACAVTIEKHLKGHADVRSVNVNFSTGKMTIEHDNPIEDIIREVSKAGFRASPVSSRRHRTEEKKDRSGINLVIISGVLLALGFLGSNTGVSSIVITLLYVLSILTGGYRPAKSAFYAAKSRSLDMNVLMTVAVLGAAAIGQWLEGATVVWLFALGNVLQTRSIEKTRNSIRGLMDLTPPEAWVKHEGNLLRKPVEAVVVGEIVVVKPGEKIPLDGEVVTGMSSVNQAPITGESIPVDKQPGDVVFGGTLNEHGTIEIRVTKWLEDTAVAKIIRLVEEAQEQKAPSQAFVDRFARIYTPVVFVAALLLMVLPPLLGGGSWEEWFYKGLELLVVACPCALVISTPVAIVSAIGNAARNGVLIKGGAFLEKAGAIQAVAFDKTGTLTEGHPKVTQVMALSATEYELLAIARTLEAYSTHPIAKSVVDYAIDLQIAEKPGTDFKNIVGKGVQATIAGGIYYAGNAKLFDELGVSLSSLKPRLALLQDEGNTLVLVGTAEGLLGLIAVADTVRETSALALRQIRSSGVQDTVMLTGDNEGTARKVASLTGVSRYYANLLPEQKSETIKRLQAEGKVVAMVGDGINDAPALAMADVGIAMGGAGTDTAMETADIVLMADNLTKLPHTIRLSRKALGIIKQNIWFSILVKVAALVLIFPDILTLWIAVLSDTGAALIVILNSMRLLRFSSK